MVIEKFPYIFKKFVKSSVALVKRNQISTWAMWKSDFWSLVQWNNSSIFLKSNGNYQNSSGHATVANRGTSSIWCREVRWAWPKMSQALPKLGWFVNRQCIPPSPAKVRLQQDAGNLCTCKSLDFLLLFTVFDNFLMRANIRKDWGLWSRPNDKWPAVISRILKLTEFTI